MPAFELRGIAKQYGSTTALHPLNLTVATGRRLVLVGASGAGKSTLLRIVAGLERPDGGTVYMGDRDVTQLPAHRRGVSLLSQDYAMYPQLTVAKNLDAALVPLRLALCERKQRIAEVLTWFQLDGLADRLPSQLSGGQLQRAAFAKAVVRRPQWLLLDEPLSQLDTPLRQQVCELLMNLAGSYSMTLVAVMHDPLDALRIAEDVAVLDRGRLVQSGEMRNVYRQPNSRLVAEHLSLFGLNELELDPQLRVAEPGQRVCFRPEVVHLLNAGEAAPDDAVAFEARIQNVQSLGIGYLINARWQEQGLHIFTAGPRPASPELRFYVLRQDFMRFENS